MKSRPLARGIFDMCKKKKKRKERETFEENATQRCADSRLTGCGEQQVPLVALRLRFFSVDHLTQRV